ncbi:MAG: HIT family protein [Acidobacteria bacterium]|nr:HIT family protein [Acidobacteriota bacterium]
MTGCIFCQIIAGTIPASIVFENSTLVVFLDHRPLFPGHCLLVPRQHLATLVDVEPELFALLSAQARQLAIAMEEALEAQGAFLAINNRVSQSVPHVHIHVVPRTKGDGLKGFFWPRQKYRGPEHMEEVRSKLEVGLRKLQQS